MQIKSFKAPTLKEAMANVKSELGVDAVILHTNKIKKGGILGFHSKEIVEVIAAVEDEPAPKPKEQRSAMDTGAATEAVLQAAAAARASRNQSAEPPQPAGNFTPRNMVNQYQKAGTLEAISQAMMQNTPSQTFGEVLASVNREQAQMPQAGYMGAMPRMGDMQQPMAGQQSMQQPIMQNAQQVPQPSQQPDMAAPPQQPAMMPMQNADPAAVMPVQPANQQYAQMAQPAPAANQPQMMQMPPANPAQTVPAQPVNQQYVQPQAMQEQPVQSVPASQPQAMAEPPVNQQIDQPVPPQAAPQSVSETASQEPVPADGQADNSQPEVDSPADGLGIKAEEAEPQSEEEQEQPDESDEISADLDDKEQEIEDLQNQLAEMKSLLVKMSRNQSQEDEVATLQRAMENQGISKHVLEDMISKLNGTEILAPQNSVKAAKALEKYIRKAIRIANGITLYSDKPKIVALIGPTGVGKTTTLAKIAAKFVLEQGAKVALITADTYRISAVEQLKTYSDILGLPLEIVYNSQALQEAIDKHQDKQLILLDTAGRSQYNVYQMKELSELLNVDADIEKHLVMSATTKTSDGLELLENFSLCNPNRVIFTKVDETKTHGLILNIMHRRKAALSYLANGQSVPDDIEPASIEKLAELLLR